MACRKRKNDELSKSKWDSSDEDSSTESYPFPKKRVHSSEGAQKEVSRESLGQELPNYKSNSSFRCVSDYKIIKLIGKGTFGTVFKAKDKSTLDVYALKLICKSLDSEIPLSALREILTMFKVNHPNVIKAREVLFNEQLSTIYISMEYVSFQLFDLMYEKKLPFLDGEVKYLIKQLLQGTAHLHEQCIMHRDLKPSNLLLTIDGVLKICDFGLARKVSERSKEGSYTPLVVTLWYRAPELLLGCKNYSTSIDMWSIGCIFAEFLAMKPLLKGTSSVSQLKEIVKCLGTPTEEIWPNMHKMPEINNVIFAQQPYNYLKKKIGRQTTRHTFELINNMLFYDPERRITAKKALKHNYFQEVPDAEKLHSLQITGSP